MRVMVILVSLRSQDWSSLLSDGTVWLANVRRWALRPAQVCVSGVLLLWPHFHFHFHQTTGGRRLGVSV